jgi:hypothetical protein
MTDSVTEFDHLWRHTHTKQLPDGTEEQSCCSEGMTAEEHRAKTSDGRCCTDVPPTEDNS